MSLGSLVNLALGLGENNSLTALDLAGAFFYLPSDTIIIDLLRTENSMGIDAVTALTHQLRKNSTLKYLCLKGASGVRCKRYISTLTGRQTVRLHPRG